MKIKFSTVKSKLLLIIIGISLGIVALAFVGYYHVNRVKRYANANLLVQSFTKNVIHLRRAEKDFLLEDRVNTDFYKSGKSEALTRFDDYYTVSKEILSELKNNSVIDDTELLRKLNSIDKRFDEYKSTFDRLVEAIKERGYGNDGLTGEMQRVAKKMYELAENIDDKSIISVVEKIKVMEKNYLLRKQTRYKDELINELNILRGLVEVTKKEDQNLPDSIASPDISISETDAVKLITSIANYQTTIEQLVDLDILIGLTAEEGLIGQSQNNIKKIEDDVESIAKTIDENYHSAISTSIFWLFLIFGLFLIALFFVLFRLSETTSRLLRAMKKQIIKLSRGELPKDLHIPVDDERGAIAKGINSLTANLKNTKEFVTEVGKGNLETEFNVFNNKGDLGNALVQMREELLKISKEREKQEIEEEKRNWGVRGIAKFNDILRQSSDNLEELSYSVIKELVQYLKADQGALFIINDENKDEKVLDLTAAFAYDRRKYMSKSVKFGEGVVGRAALEKATITLSDIPEDYYKIYSGLGKTKPKYALIVPLKLNDEVFGIFEIASLHELEKYQIEFTERVGETVASSISNVKINLRTAQLLQESKMQAEELASKEEEMRQNMEELKSTQEEAARQQAEATGFVNSVNHSIVHADFTLDGALEYANTKFLKLMGYHESNEVAGKSVFSFIDEKHLERFKSEWERVIGGGRHIESEMRLHTRTDHRWFLTTFTPVKDPEGRVTKILYLAIDVNDQKQVNLDFKGEIDAIRRSVIKAEFKADGTILNANEIFYNTLGYAENELKNKSVFYFLDKKDLKEFESIWLKIADGMPYTEQQRLITKDGKEKWFRGSYTAVNDFDGNVYKIIYIAYDITEQQKMEIATQEQAQKLLSINKEVKEKTFFYEQLLDAIRFPLFVTDVELNLTFVNKAAEKFLKIPKNEAIGKQCNIVNSEICNTENCGVVKLRQGISQTFFSKDDREYRIDAFFIKNLEGKKTGQIELYQDITEEKRKNEENERLLKEAKKLANELSSQEEELRQNLEEMQTVQDEMAKKDSVMTAQLDAINKTNALIEYELDGTVISANNIFCELFGYVESDIVERNHRMFISHDERKTDKYKQFWKELRHGQTQEGEYKRIRRDGSVIYVKAVYNPIVDQEGNPYKVLELALDITETKLQQAELAGQLNAINKTNALVEYKLDGTILTANSIFCELLNYEQNDVVGRHHRILVDNEYRKSDEYKDFWLDLRNGHYQDGEFKLLTKDDKEVYVKAIFYPMLDIQGKPYKIIELAFDITAMKHQEQKLKQQTEELKAGEEELRQNLEELQTTQDEMARRQEELQKAKQKLEANEHVLKKAIEKSKKREKEIEEKNAEIAASEEELRQNMEELQATQDAMEQKQQELEKTKQRLEVNEKVLKKAVEQSKEREKQIRKQNEELQVQEEELRQNLEELKTTQDNLEQKQKDLEKAKAELEEVRKKEAKRATQQIEARNQLMKKKMQEFSKTIETLKKQLKQREEEIKKLKNK